MICWQSSNAHEPLWAGSLPHFSERPTTETPQSDHVTCSALEPGKETAPTSEAPFRDRPRTRFLLAFPACTNQRAERAGARTKRVATFDQSPGAVLGPSPSSGGRGWIAWRFLAHVLHLQPCELAGRVRAPLQSSASVGSGICKTSSDRNLRRKVG